MASKLDRQAEGADSPLVGYDGKCLLCGSRDGMIVKSSKDGKFRNMCRYLDCAAHYLPAPASGLDSIEEVRDPRGSAYFKALPETATAADWLGLESKDESS